MDKKILILTNEFFPFKGGIGRYAEEIIKVMKDKCLVTLIAPRYDGSFLKESLSNDINPILFNGGQFKYWHLPKLINIVRKIDFSSYDNILVVDWPFWVAIAILNKFKWPGEVIKYNLMLHGSEVLNLKNGKASIFAKTVNLFKGINTIFTNSEFTKRILLENHNVPKLIPIKVTYLGVELPNIVSNEAYLLGLKRNSLYLLTVGRMDDRKGHDLVIKAIGCLEKDIRNRVIYTIVGNGNVEYKENLVKLARESDVYIEIKSGLTDTDLINEYKKTDLFVLAAKSSNRKIEGFGLVFLEAAVFGIPSLATNVGAISEVVKNNVTGFIVSESEIELSGVIKKCAIDKSILIKLSKNCTTTVTNYTWKKLTNITFAELYLNGRD